MGLEDRVARAFAGETERSFVNDYITVIRENWRDHERDVRRFFLLIALLAIGFELSSRGGIAEFTVGFVKISRLDLIRVFIPSVMAFLVFLMVTSAMNAAVMKAVHDRVVKMAYRPLYDNDLVYPMAPGIGSFYAYEPLRTVTGLGWQDWLYSTAGLGRLFVLLFSPIVYIVYSYVSLFNARGVNQAALIVGLILATVFTVAAVAVFLAAATSDDIH
jgi:hypothetical protein